MRPISIPDQLNEDQLARYLTAMVEKILDKIHEQRPDLELKHPDQKKELAQNIAKLMLENKDGQLSKEDLFDPKDTSKFNPKFLHKLTMALVMTATLGKHEDLFKKLEKLFQNKELKDEKDLKNILTPKESQELEDLQKELRALNKELFAVLKELNLLKPQPTPDGTQKEKDLEQTFDNNTNMLGLINSHQAGGLPAVVSYFIGNLYGIPNQNPNYEESFSQVAQQDKTTDTIFGDPLGLNHAAQENLEAMGDSLVGEVQSQYIHNESLKLSH